MRQCLVCCCSDSMTKQLQTLVLALAASFKAQGLFMIPQNVQLFDVFYQKLGLANAPTRRLQQQVRCSFRCSCSSLRTQMQGRWHGCMQGVSAAVSSQCMHGLPCVAAHVSW